MITRKIGPKGQVVIPSYLRKTLGIRPGENVTVEAEKGVIMIRPVKESIADRLWNLVPEKDKLPAKKIDLDKYYEEELAKR